MKDNFQSKAVPRGTRTIWRYLGALFLLFTFAIGQMWGDAASWMNNSMTPAAYFTLGSNTSAAANAKTISEVNYTHSINMTTKSNQSSNKSNGYFISFTLTSASNVSVLFGANGGGRNLRINTGWSYDASTNTTQLNNGATPSTGIKVTSDQVSNGQYGTVEISNLAAGTYYICGSGSVSVYKITITNAGGDTTAPTLSGSVPDNGDENVAVSGTIVLTFSEAIASFDASKFSLNGATIGIVAKDGSDSKKINVPYSGAANSATVTLSVAAAAVEDAAGNKSAALDDIAFTTVVAAALDTEAPTFSSSVPANSATNVAVEGTIVLTFSEAIASVDGSKFSLSGATIGTVAIDGTDSKKINVPYSGAAYSETVTLTVAKDAVADAAGNKSAALSAIAFTTVAAPSYCAELYPATSGASPTGKNQELLLQTVAPNASYGGKIYTAGAKNDNWSESFTYTANGLQLNKGGADSARVELSHLMKAGTVIYVKLVNPDTKKARGYKLLTNTGSEKATWQATSTDPQEYTYTVTAGDGLEGTNVFRLQRAESSALKELKVSNCGAELLALSSAVSVAGKGTVTLSKNLVAAGGSATATYSDIDAAYEFDGWEITSGDATIADATVNPAAITMGTTASTITLKLKAAEVKYTVTYYDGEESMGTEQVLKDGHPTATGIATRKLGYTFQGWSLTSGGAVKALNEISVTAAMPLYAVYAPVVCPTKGTVFSMSVTDAANTEYNENNAFGLEIGATYTLGIAYSGAKDETKRVGVIDENGEYSFTNNGSVTVKVALDCALAEGDVISFTSTSSKQLKIQKVAGTDLYTTSSKSFTIPAESPLIGESVFYLMRDNSGSTFKTITVSRPYTVSFNLNGQSATPIADQKVVAGGKVTKPTDPVVEGQAFGGWFQNSACTGDAWDFTNDVVNDDVELFAKWAALPKLILNRGAATTGDNVVSYPTVGDPVAVPACPFTYAGFNFVGWTYSSDVTWVDATHFTMPNEDLTLTAQWLDENTVARIGDDYYTSLKDALTAATTGQTITMIANHSVDASTKITLSGKVVTLDLNGKQVTVNRTGSGGAWWVSTDATLNLVDNTVTENFTRADVEAGTYAGGKLLFNNTEDAGKTGQLFTVEMGGILNFNSGWYESNTCLAAVFDENTQLNVTSNKAVLIAHNDGVIMGNGNAGWGGYTINISGGFLFSKVDSSTDDGCVIYHPNTGGLNISGGTLVAENGPAVVVRGGNTNVTGGTIEANGAGDYKMGDATQLVPAAGIVYDFKSAYPAGSIASTVSAGTITSVDAIYTAAEPTATEEASIAVSGGNFTEPVAESLCADGYVPETKANGKYGVIEPAQSIDFEAIIDAKGTDDEGKDELDAQLAAKHYDIEGTLNDDRLDPGSSKVADKGFKVKKTNLTISFSVEAGKVVEITTGSLSGASIKVNDAAAEAMTASHTHTYYSDDAQAFLITMTAASNKYNIFKSIVIRDPYQVTLDATTNGGEAVAPMYGKLSVTLPSATKGTDHFIGWYDRATEEGRVLVGLADAEYTPTANITLYAHFAPQSNDATLASWEIDGVDTPVPTDPLNLIHRINVPYGTAVDDMPKITAAVAHDATYAQSVVIYPAAGPEWQAGVDGGCYVQQVIVTAEDGTQGFYHVRTKVLPKDMACLVWADVPSANTLTYNATKSLMAEDAVTLAINNVSGTDGPAGVKFQKKGYIKIEMNEGTFQAGDVVALDVTGAAGSTMHVFKVQTPSSEADVIGTGEGTTTPVGVNKVAITEDAAALYLARPNDGTYNGWNPHVDYVAVYRQVPNPLVETITFNGAVATVDNDLKTITVEVPASTDMDAVPVVASFLSNDPSQTNGAVTGGTWVEGDNEYIVTDKDNDQTVYTVTITKAVPSNDATLSALSYGGTAIALADGVFEYNVELPYGTIAVPALAATAHHAGANVTDIDDAAAFVNRHATSTVTVTAEDGTTTQLYTVNFTVSRFESKVLWDGSTMTQMSDITAAATAAGVSITTTGVGVTSFSAKTCEENGKSYTKALDFGGKTQSTRNFGIEIPAGKVAKVSVVYRAKSTSRSIMIATALSDAVNESTITSKEAVDGSNLYIMTADMFGGGTLYINTTDGYHVHEISLQLADGYARSTMLGNGVYGTVCVPNNVAIEDIQGVTVYELMGREPQYGKLAFDEIISGELEAGAPYVFQAHGNHMALLYGTTSVAEPVDKHNGMYGTFEQIVLTDLTDVYYFAQKALWSCDGAIDLTVGANRAYVKLGEIDYLTDPNPAPGRRRVTMAVNGEKVTTDIENFNASEKPVKLLINGQIFILRGEKLFDATGKLVK